MPRLVDIGNISDALQERDETSPIVIYDSYYATKEILVVCKAYGQNGGKRVNFIIRYNPEYVSEKLNSIFDDMRVFREPIIRMKLKRYIDDYFGGSLCQGGNKIVYIMDDVYIDYYEIKSIS